MPDYRRFSSCLMVGIGLKTGRTLTGLLIIAGMALETAGLAGAALPTGVKFVPMFGTDAANKFTWPVCLAEIPGAPGSFLVLEKNTGGTGSTAKIWMLAPGGGPYAKSEFLSLPVTSESLSNGEVGLLGIAFHPRFRENGRYFLDFNPADNARVHAVEERRFDSRFAKDSGIALRLLSMPANGGHNGGTLAFGPDGMLYISVGDATDPRNGQKRSSLNGKILRIDVDHKDAGLEYAIPPDNPFQGAGMRGEIWAMGFRNPWRFSFDPATGALWAGDVGAAAYEEVDKVEKGGNYGWDAFEGAAGSGACSTAVCLPPVLAYGRNDGRCIIGGHVYRSDKASGFYGAYLFADYQYNGPVYAILADGAPGPLTQVGELGKAISSMAADSQGNLYVLGHDNGIIYKLDHAELKPGPVGLALSGMKARASGRAPGPRYRANGTRLRAGRSLASERDPSR
jgi:glucose/arabinose dehydrogenase